MEFKFAHNNFNVLDLEKSMKFYQEALGFKEGRRKEASDGSFILVYLTDGQSLGENEFHLAVDVDDFEAAHKKHQEMNCIVFENKAMGIYFIADPDNYWIEIIPAK